MPVNLTKLRKIDGKLKLFCSSTDGLTSPDTDSSVFTDNDQLKFHLRHGRNAAILHAGVTAIRPNATGEFNDAIVMSNRPLRDGELFEVVLEKMVDRWSGSLEAGQVYTFSISFC